MDDNNDKMNEWRIGKYKIDERRTIKKKWMNGG